MFEHNNKRPLYAFFVVAAICGIVVGTTIRSQAILGFAAPWAGPSSVVAGKVFAPAPAAADEPSAADAAAKRVHHNAPRNGLDAPPVGHRAVEKVAVTHHRRDHQRHQTQQVRHPSGSQHHDVQPAVQQPQHSSGHHNSGPTPGSGDNDGDNGTVQGFSIDQDAADQVSQVGQPGHPVVSPGISGPSGPSIAPQSSGQLSQSITPSSSGSSTSSGSSGSSSVSIVGLSK